MTVSVALLIVGALGTLGLGLLTIFQAVIGLIIAVHLFRKGVQWAKHSGN